VRPSNKHIQEALEVARELIILADVGEADAEDNGCEILYGTVRDCAYRIRRQAKCEREAHEAKGLWDAADGLREGEVGTAAS